MGLRTSSACPQPLACNFYWSALASCLGALLSVPRYRCQALPKFTSHRLCETGPQGKADRQNASGSCPSLQCWIEVALICEDETERSWGICSSSPSLREVCLTFLEVPHATKSPVCIQILLGQFVNASCDLAAAFSTSCGSFTCVSLHHPLDKVYTKVLTWALLSREIRLAKPFIPNQEKLREPLHSLWSQCFCKVTCIHCVFKSSQKTLQ